MLVVNRFRFGQKANNLFGGGGRFSESISLFIILLDWGVKRLISFEIYLVLRTRDLSNLINFAWLKLINFIRIRNNLLYLVQCRKKGFYVFNEFKNCGLYL